MVVMEIGEFFQIVQRNVVVVYSTEIDHVWTRYQRTEGETVLRLEMQQNPVHVASIIVQVISFLDLFES